MSHITSLLKLTITTIVVLLASQIQIKGKRVCDYVADVTKSSAVQKPVSYLAGHLDFTHGHVKKNDNGEIDNDASTGPGPHRGSRHTTPASHRF